MACPRKGMEEGMCGGGNYMNRGHSYNIRGNIGGDNYMDVITKEWTRECVRR